MANILEIEGVGPVYREKLIAYGITIVEGLLNAGAAPSSRSAIADETGISKKLVLE